VVEFDHYLGTVVAASECDLLTQWKEHVAAYQQGAAITHRFPVSDSEKCPACTI